VTWSFILDRASGAQQESDRPSMDDFSGGIFSDSA
jgi:hypothetical protein